MSAKCRLITAKDGNKVPVITHEGKEVRLGSLYDGRYAAERWAKRYISDGTENVILFGLGDGQLIRLLTEIVPGKILVYEPNDALYREMRHTSVFKKIQTNRKVELYVGESDRSKMNLALRILLNANCMDTTPLRAQINYDRCYAGEMEWLKTACDTTVDEIFQMKGSVKRFIVNMIRNPIGNVRYMENGIPLMRLAKYWNSDIPVIIVSAGPSLKKNMMYLKDIKGKAFMFCVDAALPNLLQNDIIPDVVACTDANKNMSCFDDDRCNEITLLITPNAPVALAKKNHANKIWSSAHPYLEALFRICGIENARTTVRLGVATLVVAALLDLGTKKIIFCGQDLSYAPDGSTHAAGRNDESFQRDKRYDTEGYFGGIVYSRYDWTITREWIEEVIRSVPDREYINATEGGAKIHGTKQMSLEEAVSELNQQNIFWEDILADERIYITLKEYEHLKQEFIKTREDLESIRDMGYEKVMLEKKEMFPAIELILSYMRSLDDKSRKTRFEKALDFVQQEFEKELSSWEN